MPSISTNPPVKSAPDTEAGRICPLCLRPIPDGAKASRHHLVPRLKGGTDKGTVLLHQICHSTIHRLFSEAELAHRLSTIEALRAAPELGPFLDWIAGKPPGFHAPTHKAVGSGRR